MDRKPIRPSSPRPSPCCTVLSTPAGLAVREQCPSSSSCGMWPQVSDPSVAQRATTSPPLSL